MDLLPNEQSFDLDKSREKFHHSLKEHITHGKLIPFTTCILQHFATKPRNITNFVMLFQAVMKFSSRSKFCSLGNRSIVLFPEAYR